MAGLAATDNMQTSQIICKWMRGDGGWVGGKGGVGGWVEASKVRGSRSGRREKEEKGDRVGGVNPFQDHFSPRRSGRRWRRCSHLPSREAHLLELMEASRQRTALGNTLQPG